MHEDAARYREQAAHCRKLAETARDDATIKRLVEMAGDFEKEALRIESEERRDD